MMLSDNLTKYMKEKGLSNVAVSELLTNVYNIKTASNTVSNYKHGRRQPPVQTVKALADILDIPVSYLFDKDEMIAKTKEEFEANPNEYLADQIAIKDIKTGKWNYFQKAQLGKYNPADLYIISDNNNMRIFNKSFGLKSGAVYHVAYFGKEFIREVQQFADDEIRLIADNENDIVITQKERKNLKIIAQQIGIINFL